MGIDTMYEVNEINDDDDDDDDYYYYYYYYHYYKFIDNTNCEKQQQNQRPIACTVRS